MDYELFFLKKNCQFSEHLFLNNILKLTWQIIIIVYILVLYIVWKSVT